MRIKMRNYGFTMAEMLIVVAIIVVLSGVGFIAVQQHQRSLTQLDRDAVAKEIYIAAQNHLSMAKSENYQGRGSIDLADFGTPGNAAADAGNDDIYYFFSGNKPKVYDQILPFGAIDNTVLGNNFIIRYQPKAAIVLDVFYWTTDSSNSRFDCDDLNAGSYATLVGDGKGDKHNNYTGKGVLGWFGGEKEIMTGKTLYAPTIEVFNEEQLYVTVKDNNPPTSTVIDRRLKLIIDGDISKAKAVIEFTPTSANRISRDVDGVYKIVLDDVTTANMHFASIETDADFERPEGGNSFIPGENITVKAVSYSNSELTSVAYSGEWTTNSLFADISKKTPSAILDDAKAEIMKDTEYMPSLPAESDPWITAKISNIRHLENLDARISYLDYSDSKDELKISNVVQISDLDWKGGFLKYFGGSAAIYDASGKAAKLDCYIPVKPSLKVDDSEPVSMAINYNGMGYMASTTGGITTCKAINYKVSNIAVDSSDGEVVITAGGMFDTVIGGSITNLEVSDIKITVASGDAGALAGTLSGTTVTNVIAINSTNATDVNVTSASGSAGGLIGSATNCTIQKSASALIVKSEGGNAGGLIGTAVGGTVSGCYAGGHAINKMNGTGTGAEVIGVTYDSDKYNVTASGVAGGLIGDAGAAEISYSYSTCSATGATVGGLIGTGSGAISSSYCTGKVSGTTQGAFAGACGTTTDCHYYEIINEFPDATVGYDYLTPLPIVDEGDGKREGIEALDVNAEEYNKFCGASTDWKPAMPYDTKLKDNYGEGTGEDRVAKYNLKTIAQLDDAETKAVGVIEEDTITTPADFVATHYGDWPAPEIFVVNTAS